MAAEAQLEYSAITLLERLETNRALTEAIEVYRSCGYREVAAFNAEPYAHHWFEKRLSRGGSHPPGDATRDRRSHR